MEANEELHSVVNRIFPVGNVVIFKMAISLHGFIQLFYGLVFQDSFWGVVLILI